MQEVIVAIMVVGAIGVTLKRYAPRRAQIVVRQWFVSGLKMLHMNRVASKVEVSIRSFLRAPDCGGCRGCSGAPLAKKQFTITPEELRRTISR